MDKLGNEILGFLYLIAAVYLMRLNVHFLLDVVGIVVGGTILLNYRDKFRRK